MCVYVCMRVCVYVCVYVCVCVCVCDFAILSFLKVGCLLGSRLLALVNSCIDWAFLDSIRAFP